MNPFIGPFKGFWPLVENSLYLFTGRTLLKKNLSYGILLNGCLLYTSMVSNFRQWYENFVFQNESTFVGFPLKCYFQCYFMLKYNRRLFWRNNNYTHQFVFGQAKWWRWIPLHSSCIVHEHIFCLSDWVMFSNYHKSGFFHYYEK